MKSVLKIAICDDENIIIKIVKEKIEKVFQSLKIDDYSIKFYNNGMDLIESKESYHLLILDIEMPGIDGLSLANKINDSKKPPLVIFVTSHKELMSWGFRVRAFRYLTKPIEDEEFHEAISSAVKEILSFDAIVLEENGKKQIVDINKIVYIESLGVGCCVHTVESQYIRKEPLKHWRKSLPNKIFFQTHRGYIVNLKYAKDITTNTVYLKTDEEVPLSFRNRKLLNDALHEFVRRKARR